MVKTSGECTCRTVSFCKNKELKTPDECKNRTLNQSRTVIVQI